MRFLLSNYIENAKDRAYDCFLELEIKRIAICNGNGEQVSKSQGIAKISPS
jgi:hypothetical protein